jgi:DNA polymerase-1
LVLDALRVQSPDYDQARDLYAELEFTTLLKELGVPTAAARAVATQVEYVLKPSAEQIAALLKSAKTGGLAVAVELHGAAAAEAEGSEECADDADVETTMTLDFGGSSAIAPKVESARSVWAGIAAAGAGEGSQVLRMDLLCDEAAPVRRAIADAKVPKQMHDVKATERALEDEGLTLAGVRDDVMLYSYLLNPTHGSHKLADLAARSASTPINRIGDEAIVEAATVVAQLAGVFREQVEASGTLHVYQEIDLPLSPVLLRMERAGVRVDLPVLAEIAQRITGEMAVLSEQIYEQSGNRFNINSPKQLGDVLFNKMGLPRPLKYGKGKVISTAQDVLEELAAHHPVPRLVLEYRGLAKLKSNYVDALPLLTDSEQRVHTTFNQVGTATGRLSSTNPNLQNIPIKTALGREIRAAFIAAPGNVLLSADYSQIELRLLAHFSGDPLLLEAFRTGQDIHTLTAAEVFQIPADKLDKQTRDRAKAINFGIVYGISAFGLAQQNIGIDQHEARMYIERYFERYAGVRTFIDTVLAETRKRQQVRTMHGRVRPIPDILSSNANMRGFAERTAVNTPLQGTAADLIKIAMIRLDAEMARRKMRSRMTLQVHDELVFDAPAAEAEELGALVKETMEHVAALSVPLVADVGVGSNWRDLD